MANITFFLSLFFFASVSFSHADPPTITGIKPDNSDKYFAGTVMVITGTNFNKDTKIKINYVSIHDKCEILNDPAIAIESDNDKLSEKITNKCLVKTGEAEIIEFTETQIKAKIPYDLLEKTGLVAEVWVENKTNAQTTDKINIIITEGEPLVAAAIRLKKSGMSASDIAEYLHNQGEQLIEDHYNYQRNQPGLLFDAPSIDNISRKTFGNIHFERNGSEVIRLREAGFENDFIEKMTGQPQYITLGAALVWLRQSQNYVITPMARIFVKPTGFYTPRKPMDIRHLWSTWDWRRVGLNIGYTPATPTTPTTETNGGNAKEMKNFILLGFCYEINRSALFNTGIAMVPGGSAHGDAQYYFGLTLDQNVLKGLGLMKD